MNAVDYRKLLSIAIFIDLVLLILIAGVKNTELGFNYSTFSLVGTLVAIDWLLWGAFKTWFWKVRILQGWLVTIPDLNGRWTGKLQSTWKNPETKQGVPAIPTEVSITQSLTTLNIDFITNEMSSKSVAADLSCDRLRRTSEIKYVYQSEPDSTVRHRSPIHYGAARLTVQKTNNKIILKGEYWTDRQTTGSINLQRKT